MLSSTTGSTITVTSPSQGAKVRVVGTYCGYPTLPDTVVFIQPSAAVQASQDTVYSCTGSLAGIPLSVTGPGPHTWSVVSGTATLSSTTGSAITVSSPSQGAKVRVVGTYCTVPTVPDTVLFIQPTATVDAGPSKSYKNCGNATTTLAGTLTGTTAGIAYSLAWSPLSLVVSGGNTLTPTVNAASTTLFSLIATTPAAQGGCSFTDTTTLVVEPSAPPFTLSSSPDSVFCTPPSANYFLFSEPAPAAGYYTYLWSGAPFGSTSPPATSPIPRPLTTTGIRTYYVEVKDTFGCHVRRDTVTLTFHNLSASLSPTAATLCPGDTVRFAGQGSTAPTATSVTPHWRYTWAPATALSCTACSSTIARPTSSTLYGLTLVDSVSGCVLYRTAQTTVFNNLDSFSAGPDVVARLDATGSAPFTLQGRAPASAVQLGWTPAQPLEEPFRAVTGGHVDSTMAFVLLAFNGPCESRDTAVVFVVGCAGLVMPNSFSPNGDAVNERFLPLNRAGSPRTVSVKRLQIFNRWGTLVYSEGVSASLAEVRGWDGRMNGVIQPAGVYVWRAEGECSDAATGERTPFEQVATVTLMR